MQTDISAKILATDAGAEANRILRSCVHCGFCTATCPTYQELGDELDGPRGRIYLIKDMLEGGDVTAATQQHLDRCLSCRACESTCPSGVEYAHLAEIGKTMIEEKVTRPIGQRVLRNVLLMILPHRSRFAFLLAIGQFFRPILPQSLQQKIPAKKTVSAYPTNQHARKVLLIEGCVQPSLSPEIDVAAAHVLDRLGISIERTHIAQCCGAVENHLHTKHSHAKEVGLNRVRANIDLWLPYLEQGAEAIISTASACALEIKEYAYLLRNDPAYAEKATKISAACRDISEIVGAENLEKVRKPRTNTVAFHASCTLQHGQKLSGMVEDILQRVGYELRPVANAHLCCGSAGTYSILEPEMSITLRDNKLKALSKGQPDIIASANIGCLNHLASGTHQRVKHWIELL